MFDLFYVGLVRDPTPPLPPLRSSASCGARPRLKLPLRARRDEARCGLVEWDFDRSSFATELSSAVERMAVCRCRDALIQRSGLIPTFSAAAA